MVEEILWKIVRGKIFFRLIFRIMIPHTIAVEFSEIGNF